jgi:two-component SAPR family response regulator
MCLDDHSCVFLEDAAQQWRICADSIAAAEQAGFTPILISERWSDSGYPPEAAGLSASLASASSFNMLDEPISVPSIIGKIRQQTEEAAAAGFAGLLLLIDMSWLLYNRSGAGYQGEFEAALQELILGPLPLRAVCLYHLPMFPEGMALDAMRTHPRVCTHQGMFENPHFLLPQTFLSGDAAAKLQAWLNSLRLVKPAKGSSAAPAPSELARAEATPARYFPSPSAFDTGAVMASANSLGQRWKVRCFGPLRIERQDGTSVQWSLANGATTKTKTLFAYLLHCGVKGATSEELTDLLWPQVDCLSKSLNRLYHTIHCLRIALSPELKCSRESPYVLGHEGHYQLRLPQGTWVDVPVFEQLCHRGEKLFKSDRIEDALVCYLSAERLYTGQLLTDIPPEYTQNIDRDWCWSRRFWFEEIYVKLLANISQIYRRFDELERAVVYAEKALELEPCFEPAHQELMHIFHLSGRRDAVERQYRLCTGVLKRQENRAPSENTQGLFRRLVS